jgi:multiple sugar transport system permease protein
MTAVTAFRTKPRQPGKVVTWVAEHTLLAFLLVLFAAPILFVALTSFMTDDQALTSALWPNPWTL